MYKLIISPKAKQELKDISYYIGIDNEIIAKKVINKIFYTLGIISTFPYIGKKVNKESRQIVESDYKFRIIYRIKKNNIEIISIFKNKNLY